MYNSSGPPEGHVLRIPRAARKHSLPLTTPRARALVVKITFKILPFTVRTPRQDSQRRRDGDGLCLLLVESDFIG